MGEIFVDNFKDILRNFREYFGLKNSQIYHGLCSEETSKKYESGELSPDLLLFFTVLERLGISSERFEIILPDVCHEFILWYENCICYAENQDVIRFKDEKEKFQALYHVNKKIQFQQKAFIDYIDYRVFEKDLEKAYCNIVKAIQYTIEDVDKIIEQNLYLSMFEWHLLINYFDVLYEYKKEDKADISKKVYALSQYLLKLPIDDLIRAGIIPKLVLTLFRQDEDFLSASKRLELLDSIFKMSIKYMRVREMPEILSLLIKEEPAYYRKNAYTFWKHSLEYIFSLCGLKADFRIEFFSKELKYLVLSDVLKQKRKRLGMTIEEVCENICDVKTYRRMEKGQGIPYKSILKGISDKLELKFRYFRTEVVTDDVYALFLAHECRRLLAIWDIKELKIKCDELKKLIGTNDMVNRQEIEFIELILNGDMGEKEKAEHLWKIFRYTASEFTGEEFLSIREIEILTYIAGIMVKNQVMEKINLLEKILESENNRKCSDHYARLAVPLGHLVGAYKDNKEYDKAYTLGIEFLKSSFKNDNATFLLTIIDYLSTIEEENGDIKKAEELCRHLFYIAELYEKYSDTEMIRAYHERVFNPKEAWYLAGV